MNDTEPSFQTSYYLNTNIIVVNFRLVWYN